MQQKKKSDYTRAISMEEYLTRRKQLRNREQSKGREERLPDSLAWMPAELNI